jgi:hypothetical protein
VNRLRLALQACISVALLALARGVHAQNLLATNAGFEANTAYYTPDWGFPQGSTDALPGWIIVLDPTGDGYAGAADNQSPQNLEGTHFGYIYSGTGTAGMLETSPDSRAPVQKGTTYTLWFLARGDATWSDALATVSLIWHPNQNNGATVGSPTNLDLDLPAKVLDTDPMQTFSLTAVAPPGAHYAGVCITRPAYDYAPIIVDDFVIMAEPQQVSLSIQQKGQSAVLAWPRSHKYQLQAAVALPSQGNWQNVATPARGVGATNSVESPITNNACLFRLVSPN